LLAEHEFAAVIVDRALAAAAADAIVSAAARVPRRIVLVTPDHRDDLAALKDNGFTGYLVKPVRAASLAMRLVAAPDFDDADAATQRDATVRADAAAPATAGLAVLVAEDNEINALLARALLVRLGHRPTIATTGTQVIDSWLAAHSAGEPYDFILMDVHMPELDGIDAARHIRALEAVADGPRTPIVALTANALDEDREACLAAGMDAFLTKPLDRERLAELLTAERLTIAA